MRRVIDIILIALVRLRMPVRGAAGRLGDFKPGWIV